jgi:hypothetical protein
MPARIRDKLPLQNRLRRQWEVSRNPALRADVNRLQKPITHKMKTGGMTSGS